MENNSTISQNRLFRLFFHLNNLQLNFDENHLKRGEWRPVIKKRANLLQIAICTIWLPDRCHNIQSQRE